MKMNRSVFKEDFSVLHPQTQVLEFPGATLTYYLCGQLGSLLLKHVFHLLDVESLCLHFI